MSNDPMLERQPTSPEDRVPAFVGLSEHVLHSSDLDMVTKTLDVAIVFYGAMGTIAGSLCGAFIYPIIHPFTPSRVPEWIFLLLCTVGCVGALGFAAVCIILNARGYIAWENKWRARRLAKQSR